MTAAAGPVVPAVVLLGILLLRDLRRGRASAWTRWSRLQVLVAIRAGVWGGAMVLMSRAPSMLAPQIAHDLGEPVASLSTMSGWSLLGVVWCGLVFTPLLGHVPRKRLIAGGLLAGAALLVTMALADDLSVVLACAALIGFGSFATMLGPAAALSGAGSRRDQRLQVGLQARWQAWLGTAGAIATGAVADIAGWRTTVMLHAVAATAAALLALPRKRNRSRAERPPRAPARKALLRAQLRMLAQPAHRLRCRISAVDGFIAGAIGALLTFHFYARGHDLVALSWFAWTMFLPGCFTGVWPILMERSLRGTVWLAIGLSGVCFPLLLIVDVLCGRGSHGRVDWLVGTAIACALGSLGSHLMKQTMQSLELRSTHPGERLDAVRAAFSSATVAGLCAGMYAGPWLYTSRGLEAVVVLGAIATIANALAFARKSNLVLWG